MMKNSLSQTCSKELWSKAEHLEALLRQLQPGLAAVSGGIDSRVLLEVILASGLDFQPVFFSGPHMSSLEANNCLEYLGARAGKYRVLELDPLQDEAVRNNDPQRCYHCKLNVFSQALQLGHSLGRDFIVEGTQGDDAFSYRPGKQALVELGIRSPLYEAGLGKREIRSLAREMGLPHPEQASRPCLLTRFAYHMRPSHYMLQLLGSAEDFLQGLGLHEFRIRVLPQEGFVLQIARSEQALYDKNASAIHSRLRTSGLVPYEILVTDTISGFFD